MSDYKQPKFYGPPTAKQMQAIEKLCEKLGLDSSCRVPSDLRSGSIFIQELRSKLRANNKGIRAKNRLV